MGNRTFVVNLLRAGNLLVGILGSSFLIDPIYERYGNIGLWGGSLTVALIIVLIDLGIARSGWRSRHDAR